jgi:hypothetical protein
MSVDINNFTITFESLVKQTDYYIEDFLPKALNIFDDFVYTKIDPYGVGTILFCYKENDSCPKTIIYDSLNDHDHSIYYIDQIEQNDKYKEVKIINLKKNY